MKNLSTSSSSSGDSYNEEFKKEVLKKIKKIKYDELIFEQKVGSGATSEVFKGKILFKFFQILFFKK